MKNKEILKKAIEKAIKNDPSMELLKVDLEDETEMYELKSLGQYWWIFYHEFAKAFWGEREIRIPDGETMILNEKKRSFKLISEIDNSPKTIQHSKNMFEWEYHLQQMVLEEDPIKYLEKFL